MQIIRTNLTNNASTEYTNCNFQSMILFNGTVLGAGSDGIRKLNTGSLDVATSISAYFKTGLSTLNWIGKKKNRFIYLGVETDGNIIITPIIDGANGTPITFTSTNNGKQFMKMSVPNNNMGYYWGYKVENVSGCWFSVDEVIVLPTYLSKRK